jgi:CRP-like cAMP-binding protein
MKPANPHILTVNGGSSSIKFALFEAGNPLRWILGGEIERIGVPAATFKMKGLTPADNFAHSVSAPDYTAAVGALSDCTLYRIEKALMVRLLHEEHGISELFITHLLTRNTRFEEDLVDQLFNSSEKRLARILLLRAHFGKESRTETIHPGIYQEHLAQMVGTTRSRVSHFMNKFSTLGFIDYTGNGALTVNNGLLSVILSE